jgi:hypothetical protein
VAELIVNDAAGTPPKLTAVAVVKSVPVIVTVIPVYAETGKKPETVGGMAKQQMLHARHSNTRVKFFMIS